MREKGDSQQKFSFKGIPIANMVYLTDKPYKGFLVDKRENKNDRRLAIIVYAQL